MPLCQLLEKHNRKQLIQHLPVGLKYFLKTIRNVSHLRLPIEGIIRSKFILAVRQCQICCDKERVLISLQPGSYGGLAIPIFHEITEIEFMTSSKITSEL